MIYKRVGLSCNLLERIKASHQLANKRREELTSPLLIEKIWIYFHTAKPIHLSYLGNLEGDVLVMWHHQKRLTDWRSRSRFCDCIVSCTLL